MKWRDEISSAIAAAFKPELNRQLAELREYVDGEFAAVHAHLNAVTETLADAEPQPGELTTDQRTGLHAIRAQVGAKHNPPPTFEQIRDAHPGYQQ